MSDNGNHPEIRAVEARGREVRRRIPGSGPILLLALLFLVATFLAWYFTWFGRELSDADITKYLTDTKNPRHVQHALLQIQQRMERGDTSAKNWYPQLVTLSGDPETEFRLTVAWLMGFDNKSPEFHEALKKLLQDQEPLVRRNAALALVRFNDASGRGELVSVLVPYPVRATTGGVIASSLKEGSQVARGTLLARIQQPDEKVIELRSPLPGRINKILKTNGAQVSTGDEVMNVNSDEGSVWEALRGLALIGTKDDLPAIQSYADSTTASERVREQARLTIKQVERAASQAK
ncbi:MAG TPA: HEAT repeat domain-containing protein [Pyrinomonadaceae bacterium]|nr:HEAT repeat domain-containing protein [Pyrinomonadaceae bacterium]